MRERQTLIIDGDDTLWENNLYFEQAIEDFIDFLGHATLTREQVRATLDEVEYLNAQRHGYGSAAFARNLRETYERLAERQVEHAALDHVIGLARRITEVALVLLPDVPETLSELQRRHRLLLFTKGSQEEQELKVQQSGLLGYFDAVIIDREKKADSYRALITEQAIDPARGWMAGNSPKADIIPALDVGLGAVFVPHARTWRLEQAELPVGRDRLRQLRSFAELRDYF